MKNKLLLSLGSALTAVAGLTSCKTSPSETKIAAWEAARIADTPAYGCEITAASKDVVSGMAEHGPDLYEGTTAVELEDGTVIYQGRVETTDGAYRHRTYVQFPETAVPTL